MKNYWLQSNIDRICKYLGSHTVRRGTLYEVRRFQNDNRGEYVSLALSFPAEVYLTWWLDGRLERVNVLMHTSETLFEHLRWNTKNADIVLQYAANLQS
jgi:hypothetical protein